METTFVKIAWDRFGTELTHVVVPEEAAKEALLTMIEEGGDVNLGDAFIVKLYQP